MKIKHTKIEKKHNFERGALKLMVEGWSHLTKGMEMIDKAILWELLSQRKEDKRIKNG